MKQAEIWYADLNPVKGSEQAGYRPVVIISGDLLNKYLKIVIACPLTTSVKNYKGNAVLEPSSENGLEKTSEILVFHIRSISKDRLVKRIGHITSEELEVLKSGLNDILKY
ncbi:MAG: type II toxin-antitoxin system PemK/MazF family toxin [Bacteroidetes bacterium]|nr:MAG: type II toxin-antitoxin system PemK/MazF family toxin [Bacteroidota bacterium]RLD48665.1 MAG: type II toxin-antitoxin system PemK/MazF family toxin [Bacteroidota bacterium]